MRRVFAIVALFAVILTGQTIESKDNGFSLPACATEDSDNCIWNAETMGNGKGRSFIVRDGVVTYFTP